MEEAITKIIKKAEATGEVLNGLNGKLKNQGRLWKYFHLRPNSDDVTIVSHHPFAPMRGIHRTINSRKESLKDTLLSLDEYLDTLADAESDKEKFCRELNSFDFPRRGKDTEEEKIQAAFISGMISRDAEYEGIHFLASELILLDENNPKRNRFDVVGYKNHILYIFELKPDGYKETKRKRDEGIFDQIIRYRDHFDANSQKFKTLFAAYPRIACPETVEKIETVKYIAVMKEEQLSTYDWMEEAKNARVDVWLFRSALAFRKVSQ